MSHTPGPWKFAGEDHGNLATHISTDNYMNLIDVPWPNEMSQAEWRLNKALVGAAPDMLEALKCLVAAANKITPLEWRPDAAIAKAEAALNKATTPR